MKRTLKTIAGLALCLVLSTLALTGCVESHYYHHYHHHSRDWYDHHREPYPPGVDFNVDVR
jgi:hypothetical protein